jgi:hypothetical protein
MGKVDNTKLNTEVSNNKKFIRYLGLFIGSVLLAGACSDKNTASLEPKGMEQVITAAVETGNLRAVFVDNQAFNPDHKAGYNGIAELYHTRMDSNIFVPAYAGFNLEHIFSGDSLEEFFEPRVHPMTLYKKNNSEVLLYQKPTPVSGVESLTEFKLVPPHYIDISFRCVLHNRNYFRHNYAGFFWASYINKPFDRNIYFKGVQEDSADESWISAYSEKHGYKSTHKKTDDNHDFYFIPGFGARLANNYSGYRFTEPFYYGHFHNMVLAFLFDSDEIIRFTQSPTGGGSNNPAWDFQYLIPNPQTCREYSFIARLVYKPFTTNEDIVQEHILWKSGKRQQPQE